MRALIMSRVVVLALVLLVVTFASFTTLNVLGRA